MFFFIVSFIFIGLIILRAIQIKSCCLYSSLWQYNIITFFYLVLPMFFLGFTANIFGLQLDNNVIHESQNLASLFLVVNSIFIIVTMIVNNNKNEICSNYYGEVGLVNKIIYCFIVILSVVVFFNVKDIYFLNGRALKYAQYQIIFNKYYLNYLFFIALFYSNFFFLKKNKYIYFFPVVMISLLELFSYGRSFVFMLAINLYMLIIIRNKKVALRYTLYLISIIIVMVVWRKLMVNGHFSGDGWVYFVYSVFSEFFHTALTTPIAINSYIRVEYLQVIISIVNLPLSIINILFNIDMPTNVNYSDVISSHITNGMGFATNPITEGLVLIGAWGVIVISFLYNILFFFMDLNKNKGIYYLIMLLTITPFIRLSFRSGLFDIMPNILFLFFVLLFISCIKLNLKR